MSRRIPTFRRSVRCLALLALGLCHTEVGASVYPDRPDQLWPGGVVPYEYDPDVMDGQKCCAEAAMAIWEAEAGIIFVPRTDEDDYLKIQRNTVGPNYPPPVGYRAGDGGHVLNLSNWCDGVNSCGTETVQQAFGLVHEIGHVLGLSHTQQRTDRNDFLTVNTCRVDPAFIGNYDTVGNSLAWPRDQMDVDSIMSYPVCVYSICQTMNCPDPAENCLPLCGTACSSDYDNCETITFNEPLASQWEPLRTCPSPQAAGDVCVGQRNHLSKWEKLVIKWLYPPVNNWVFVEKDYTGEDEDGTFYFPYKMFETGEDNVSAGGTLWIQPGAYDAVDGVYDKAVTVKAPLGGVVID